MAMSDRLKDLIERSSVLWAGEAEVVRSYFNSSERTTESDLTWLKRQCYKEFFGSGLVDPEHGLLMEWGREIMELRPQLDTGYDRHELLDLVEAFYAEYHHYCLYADIYDELSPDGAPKLAPKDLENWPEGATLDNYRIEMRARHGDLGDAALGFTEGGYCTLFSEGAALAGRGGIDEKIARASRKVYEDEVEHMLRGVVAVGELDRSDEDWELIDDLVMTQLRMRVQMRNGQFGHPVPLARIEAIFAGEIEPIAFDYGMAERAAA